MVHFADYATAAFANRAKFASMVGRPKKSKVKVGNRLREIRERNGLSVDELSDISGMTKDQIYNQESGRSMINQASAAIYARALGVTAGQIMGEGEAGQVVVKGYVGAGAEVFPFEGADDELDRVDPPGNLDPDRLTAYIIEGDSMLPIEPRSIVFVSELRGDPIGKHCLVDLADGRRLFKHVMKGATKGRFNLLSWNAPIIADVVIRHASRVEAIQKPRGKT